MPNPNANYDKATQQFEALFLAPARNCASMALDYSEQVFNTQFGFAKACIDTGIDQARTMLDIKDAEGLRGYVEGQQKAAKELSERLAGEAEKVVSLNQQLMQKGQEMAESNMQDATKAAKQASK